MTHQQGYVLAGAHYCDPTVAEGHLCPVSALSETTCCKATAAAWPVTLLCLSFTASCLLLKSLYGKVIKW